MELSGTGNWSDEEPDQTNQESYRREIEDIVKGFILEKELLLQGHQEEIGRIRDEFSSERSGLYEQFEKEKTELMRSSHTSVSTERHGHRFEGNSAQEYGLSSSTSEGSGQESTSLSPRKSRHRHDHASNGISSSLVMEMRDEIDAQEPRVALFSGQQSGVVSRGAVNASSLTSPTYVRHSSDAVDLSLVREIAEVYMRMNSGRIASQVRPDLDLEDKFERERDALERRFQIEKREVRRKFEDDYRRKMEQERSSFEEQIQELKTVNSDLQWQKKDLENRLRHDKEKWELTFEREKNDFEKKQLQSVHDIKRKLEEKHTIELQKQRQKYEENISELQTDIAKLTAQLRELNENLAQEKDIIMIKFEREIKEMEQVFIDQRNALKISLESEFSIRLENETIILKTVNTKLKDELETLERGKKEVERKYKDERRKVEESHDEEISEMERNHSEEKRTIKARYEERFNQLLENDKKSLEETILELTEEVIALREENSQIQVALGGRNEELRQQIEQERAEARHRLTTTREEVKAQIELEYSQRTTNVNAEKESQTTEHTDKRGLPARGEEKDWILRENEQLKQKIESLESDLSSQRGARANSSSAKGEAETLRGVLSAKENEVASVKLENQELEINLSALKREKMDLEDEFTVLKRRLAQASLDASVQKRDNGEVETLQQSLRRKDEEVRVLQKGTFDAESKQASLQRKHDDLEDELAIMRRKKLEVEDEISALKRDKSDLESHFTSLRKEKEDIEELFMNLKRKMAELEDMVSASKRERMDMEHEIFLLKKQNTTMEIDIQRDISSRDGQTSFREVSIETAGASLENSELITSKKEVDELKAIVRELAEKRTALEAAIAKLTSDREKKMDALGENSTSDLVNRGGNLETPWVLERQEEEMNNKISILKEECLELENRLSHLRREVASNEESCKELKETRNDLEETIKTLKFNKNLLEKAMENREWERDEWEHGRGSRGEVNNGNAGQERSDSKTDKDIGRLTDEKRDLQKELSSVKKQLALLQSELSTTKEVQLTQDALKIDEREISRLKKSSLELERQIAILKRQKTEIEAEITVIGEVKSREETDLNAVRRERVELDIQLTALQCQKTRLEAEIDVIKNDKKKSETEVESLRTEKSSMEKQVYGIQSQKLKLQVDVGAVEESWRKKGDAVSGLASDVADSEKQLKQLRQQKADLQAEIIQLRHSKSKEEGEITSARQQKQDLEREVNQLKSKTTQLDGANSQRYQAQITTAEERGARSTVDGPRAGHHYSGSSHRMAHTDVGVKGLQENGPLSGLPSHRDRLGGHLSGSTQFCTNDGQTRRHHENFASTNMKIHRFEDVSGMNSYGREEGSQFFGRAGAYDSRSQSYPQSQQNNDYLSQELRCGSHLPLKEDNPVVSLRNEKQSLQLEISELRIMLAKLQTQIANARIEIANNGSVVTVVRSDREDSYSAGLQEQAHVSKPRGEDRRDALIRDYEAQIRELKQRKVELEQRVSVLEWQLENTKQKMEIQEMSYRRELSSAREKVFSTGSAYSTLSDREAEKLKAFYDRVSCLLVKKDGSSEDIMKQITMEMKNLDQKVTIQCRGMSEFRSTSSSTKSQDRMTNSSREESGQMRLQLEAADEQLKACESIIHRLYGENEDLTKVISKLEGNLKAAGRTEEKLQRKKFLLQKLVDQLSSGHVDGKETIEQSYLVVELDKDVSV